MMKTHLQTSRVHQQTLLSPVASAIPSSSWLLCNLRGGGGFPRTKTSFDMADSNYPRRCAVPEWGGNSVMRLTAKLIGCGWRGIAIVSSGWEGGECRLAGRKSAYWKGCQCM